MKSFFLAILLRRAWQPLALLGGLLWLGPALAAPGPRPGAGSPAQVRGVQAAVSYSLQGDRGLPIVDFGARRLFLDLDFDGDQDVLYQLSNTSGAGVEVRLNSGGTFGPAIVQPTGAAFTSGPLNGVFLTQILAPTEEVVDLDNDGDQDLVEYLNGTTPRVIRNNGNGTFTSVDITSLPVLTFGARHLFVDMDKDGDPDILYQNGNVSGVNFAVQLNNGNNTFAAAFTALTSPFTSGPLNGITFTQLLQPNFQVADLDDDGDQDIVDIQNATTPRLLRNNGNSTFTAVNITSLPSLTFGARYILFDVESDGDPDILYQTGNTSGAGVVLQLNNSDGTFAAAINQPTSAAFTSGPLSGMVFGQILSPAIGTVDYDDDGDADIIDIVNTVAPRSLRQEGTRPLLSSTAPADNATGVSPSTNIVLTFDRSVVKGNGNLYLVRTSDNVVLETVAVGSATITGSGTTWTYNPGVTLAVSTGYALRTDDEIFLDADGRAFAGIFDNTTYNFTTGAATTTVSSIVRASANPTNAASVNYTVTFGASVTGLTVSSFSLTPTGVSGAGLSSVSGSGTTYTVVVNTGTGDGTLRLNLANATGLSPGISTALPFAGEVYTIDKTAPTVLITSSTGASGSTSGNATFAYTVNFSESVTGFVAGDVTVSNGTLSGFSGSGSGPYTFSVTPTANGAVTVNVPVNVAQDAAANGNTAATQYSITYSQPVTAAPVVMLPANGSFSNTTTPTYGGTAVANATVTVLVDGTSIGITIASAAGTWSLLQPTALAQGSHAVRATAQSSGSAVSADSNTNTFTVDTVSPTVSIASSTAASGGSSGSATFAYTVSFSESVTGFVASDVSVGNGTLSGFSGSGSGPYTFSVTPTANGVVTVNVPVNVAQDAAANGNTAATQYSITYSQPVTAAPVVTLPANGSFSNTTTPTYGGTAVAGSTVTVLVDGSSIGTTTATGGGTWSLLQPTALAQGSHAVRATAQSSGSAVSANSNTNTFTVDTVSPTVSIASTTAANGGTSGNATFAYTVNFSESVTGFVAGDVTVGNGTLSGFSGSGSGPYTFSVTPTANGAVTVNVPVNVAQDAAANGNTAATQYSITYSQAVTAAPVVTLPANGSFSNTTTPTYGGTAVANATVTVLVDGTSIGTTTATGGGTWSLLQPTALAQGSHAVRATAQSSGSAVSADSNTNTFTVDTVSPTVVISSSAGASGSTTATTPIPFTVTFSESVTGFVAVDVSVSNGTISGFAGAGTSYTFNVTPTIPGAVTVNVAVNTAQDGAGNGNTAASQFTITYNLLVTAAPVVTAPANGSLLNTVTPTYSGTAPAGSNVVVEVDGAVVGNTTATGGTWSVVQSPGLSQGSHSVRATAQLAGQGVSLFSNTNTFTVDTVSPTVVISSSAGGSGSTTATTPIPFTVTFSEAVTGFVAGDVSVSNGTISGFAGAGTTYTFSVTPTTAGTVTTVNVAANGAQDGAGNGNLAAAPFNITYQPTTTSWTGLMSTDWFMPDNWSAGVPTATVDAIIPVVLPNTPLIAAGTAIMKALTLNAGATLTQTGGTLDVRGNLTNNGSFSATGGTLVLGSTAPASLLGSSATRFWNLTVGPGGGQSGTSASTAVQRRLTLTGNFSTQGNPLTLESSSSGTALVVNSGGVVTGAVTVQRYIDPSQNAGLGYRHYSAPVSNSTVADLSTAGFAPVLNPTYNTSATPYTETPFPTVFGYDQARLSLSNNLTGFDKGWFSPAASTDPLTVGRGYTVNIGAAQLVDFVGTLTSGDQAALVLNRNAGVTAPDAGWQLLGNPYPAPLDYSLVAPADRPNLDAAMYVFASTSQYAGQYRAYVNGIGGNPVVPVAQGFFTRVSTGQTSGSFTFRNSQRLTTFEATPFLRGPLADTRPRLRLTLTGTSTAASDDAYVYFEAGATAGADAAYDAVKLPNSTGLNLASGAGQERFAINGLPLNPTAAVTVPLFIGVPATGTYTLHAAQLLNFAPGTQPLLRDRQLGTLTDLSQHPTYTFTLNAANPAPRFELVFGAQVLGAASAQLAAQVAVYPNPASRAVFVELPLALSRRAVTAALVDGLGRVVRTQTLPAGQPTHMLPLSNLATGVYALRLLTEAGVVVKKLVVE